MFQLLGSLNCHEVSNTLVSFSSRSKYHISAKIEKEMYVSNHIIDNFQLAQFNGFESVGGEEFATRK